MPKLTVKDLRKRVREKLEKSQNPPALNPIDQMLQTLKKVNGTMK